MKKEFILLDSFQLINFIKPFKQNKNSRLSIYSFKNKKKTYLIINTIPDSSDDLIPYLFNSAPEVYNLLNKCMQRGSLLLDLINSKAWNTYGPDTQPDTINLLEALGTISLFPQKYITIPAPSNTVSIILSAGKGSRMHSKELHKVCFPIAGRPAINRLVDQIESVSVKEHIVVVGEKGKQVVKEVSDVKDGVAFVYQTNQNGTGNAAKQAAYLLRSQKFKGFVLVIPGDKVLEESSLVRLRESFLNDNADLALVTTEKELWPGAGRILYNSKGQPIDIIERRDIQKMILSKKLLTLKRKNKKASPKTLLIEILNELPSSPKARLMFPELMKCLENCSHISLKELETMIPESETHYSIQDKNELINLSGEDIERITPNVNASVYLFSSEAFYKSLFKITFDNAQKEEYLTDVVRILATDTEKSWKIITVPVENPYEVMSYNNPEELLKIEEYYNQKESRVIFRESIEKIEINQRKRTLRPVEEWIKIFHEFGPKTQKLFYDIYGENENVFMERRETYLQALKKFIKVYGKNHAVIISRSPGRINLLGRHIDHRGGFANYMTINNENILVAGLRDDDYIEIHNIDSDQFRPRGFSIGDELSRLPWDEWLNKINSETALNMIRSSSGDWSNYFRAAALRIQDYFKEHLLNGFNGVLSGKIPQAAGLSSSSSLVVSAAEAITFLNGLEMVPKEFVDLCGEGEWFVGTRGGSGDHAAMKFGEKGNIMHMGFFELRVVDIIPFPDKYRLFILQSHQYAKKSEGCMQIYNEKVASYEVAHEIVKLKYPHLKDRIVYLRDIITDALGLKPHEIYNLLLSIPEYITRKEIMEILDSDAKYRMEKIFSSHKEPSRGYEARNVALFGLAEIARAQMFAQLIKDGEIEKAGHLMNISHDGDRVSRLDEKGDRIKFDNSCHDDILRSHGKSLLCL